MSAYSRKAHAAYFRHLLRHFYVRALLASYAFFVIFGVMPKPGPRSPFQSALDHMIETVGRSLGGFAALAVILVLVFGLWALIAVLRGSKPPAPSVPDQAHDGGPL